VVGGVPVYSYESVVSWALKVGIKIALLELLLVPMHVNNNHWLLVAVDLRGSSLHLFDSHNASEVAISGRIGLVGGEAALAPEAAAAAAAAAAAPPAANDDLGPFGDNLRAIARWVRDEMLDKTRTLIDVSGWTAHVHPRGSVPQQVNDNDCGVFCLSFADDLVWGRKWSFGPDDVRFLRLRLALPIIASGPAGVGFDFCAPRNKQE
jgi:hypothetical protein